MLPNAPGSLLSAYRWFENVCLKSLVLPSYYLKRTDCNRLASQCVRRIEMVSLHFNRLAGLTIFLFVESRITFKYMLKAESDEVHAESTIKQGPMDPVMKENPSWICTSIVRDRPETLHKRSSIKPVINQTKTQLLKHELLHKPTKQHSVPTKKRQ
jgi:hypothetical protein